MKKPDFALKIALKSKSINDGRVLKNLPNKVVNELRKALMARGILGCGGELALFRDIIF